MTSASSSCSASSVRARVEARCAPNPPKIARHIRQRLRAGYYMPIPERRDATRARAATARTTLVKCQPAPPSDPATRGGHPPSSSLLPGGQGSPPALVPPPTETYTPLLARLTPPPPRPTCRRPGHRHLQGHHLAHALPRGPHVPWPPVQGIQHPHRQDRGLGSSKFKAYSFQFSSSEQRPLRHRRRRPHGDDHPPPTTNTTKPRLLLNNVSEATTRRSARGAARRTKWFSRAAAPFPPAAVAPLARRVAGLAPASLRELLVLGRRGLGLGAGVRGILLHVYVGWLHLVCLASASVVPSIFIPWPWGSGADCLGVVCSGALSAADSAPPAPAGGWPLPGVLLAAVCPLIL